MKRILTVVAILIILLAAFVGGVLAYTQEVYDSDGHRVAKHAHLYLQGPTAVAGSAMTVFDSLDVLLDKNFCVYLQNTGGGNGGDLTDASIQTSPDNFASTPVTLLWTDCDSISSGQMCTYCVSGNAYKWIRVQATAAVDPNDTTVTVWFSSNQ